MNTGVIHINVVGTELYWGGEHGWINHRVVHGLGEFLSYLTVSHVLVTQSWHIGIIDKLVNFQPPSAYQRCHERSDHTSDVDEHVENLETAIAFVFGFCQCFGTFLGSFGFEIVVHLTYQSLQVAFEQTVTEGDE